MKNWTEIRTAATVAKVGTISSAAKELGVHRATVNRHVDALEAELGAKLFQRHNKGFTPTELGQSLLRIANATSEQFEQLHRNAQEQDGDLTGEFIVTSLDDLSPLILPALAEMSRQHPKLTIRFLGTHQLLKLEYGEAHVAFRAGRKPQEPDNVVRNFASTQLVLAAHDCYIERYGLPQRMSDFTAHRFVGSGEDEPRPDFLRWMKRHVPEDAIVFKSSSMVARAQAVKEGVGIGFMTVDQLEADPLLTEVVASESAPLPEWVIDVWMVTHVDLHRSAKVQAFRKILDEIEPPTIKDALYSFKAD